MSAKQFQIKELSPIAPPFGGVSVYLRRLIEALNREGFSVGGYYTTDNTDPEVLNSPLFDLFEWEPSWPKIKRLASHIRRLIKASKEYDIIHIHGQELIYLPALIHYLTGQKIIVTVHNAMMSSYYYQMSWLNRIGFKYLAKSDIKWIAVSKQAKGQLQRTQLALFQHTYQTKRNLSHCPIIFPNT